MGTGIEIFSNPQFGQLRTQSDENGEILFCANDVCNALQYSNARDAILRHVDKADVVKRDTPTYNQHGTKVMQSMTFLYESGLYALIFGSKLEKAREFKRWVTNDVLPSLRKTGAYSIGLKGRQLPQSFSEALQLAADQARQIEEQERLIADQRMGLSLQGRLIKDQEARLREKDEALAEVAPKVNYLDRILGNRQTVTTTQIAQDYGMSAKAFNKLLHEEKIQHKVGGQWILYSPYHAMGYVHSETFVPEGCEGKVVMNTKWTQKGRLFLYEKLKKAGILPLIERD